MNIIVPPTIVQVTPHAKGTDDGVSAVAIRVASIAATMVGRIRREKNFNATPAFLGS
jgi:hypothetical protein